MLFESLLIWTDTNEIHTGKKILKLDFFSFFICVQFRIRSEALIEIGRKR